MVPLNGTGINSSVKYLIAVILLSLLTTVTIWVNLPWKKVIQNQTPLISHNPKIGNVNHPVVIYNRVPKTGSTTFLQVAYNLTLQNQFIAHYLLLDSKHHAWNTLDGLSFVHNITTARQKYPVLYHGHFPFISLQKHGLGGSISYINVIRNPLERFVSYYYFLRYGDDFRPNVKRKRMGDTMSFDDCVLTQRRRECRSDALWLQIPFFCGKEPFCWKPGNKWAFETAKRNLIDQYLVVGISEQMGDFVRLIEHLLPTFFRGAKKIYFDDAGRELHLRNTKMKDRRYNDVTLEHFKADPIWQKENEFYEFAKQIFEDSYKSIFASNLGDPQAILQPSQFKFVKIHGPS